MRKFNTRLFAGLLAVFCCMTTLSATAYADGGYYEQSEDGSETPPSSIDSITISTESVKLPEQQGSEALTPDGNLTLIDDILQSAPYASVEEAAENKQFITVQSKNGNYFYIVIDRSGDTENVYFLNLVDEADLMALMEDSGSAAACSCKDKCEAGAVNTACAVCKNNMTECMGKEKVTEKTPEDRRSQRMFSRCGQYRLHDHGAGAAQPLSSPQKALQRAGRGFCSVGGGPVDAA